MADGFLVAAAILWSYPSAAAATTPNQFVAKIYTDGLGRIPDPSGWQNSFNTFNALGCSASSLQTFGGTVMTSGEYQAFPYDNAARLLTLYRTVLNREPDSAGFNSNLQTLDNGGSWSAMVNSFFSTTEFQQLAPSICNPPSDFSYSFGSSPVIDIPVSGSGFQGSGDQLQSLLNSTSSGQTVWLAQKAVIRLTSPLVIPSGVTLATTGNPPHNNYALMARLVRAAAFNAAAVMLNSGAKLQHVWVDGQRGQIGFDASRINIEIEGGSGTEVSNCMITNTSGGTNLKALGTGEGLPCASSSVLQNLVTAYSTSHFNFLWSDGVSIACENTTVYDNEIVDATDVGIVLFDGGTAVQRSQVYHNRILNSGNSAYGGIVADPWTGAGIQHDYTGAAVYDNTLWTGAAHYEIVLSLGNRPWFDNNSATGIGVSFTSNNTGSFSANANTGIVVSGMLNVTEQNNNLSLNLNHYCACPQVAVAAAVSAGYASGNIQRPYTDVNVPGCI
ncbi:MAG TPA: DUF4214 domain-containing protein [Thermoanaerobaculia bacterium]|nr:DUF4214 domain-containing protein [Thermoanaerobaculia bacterium]